MNNKKNLVRILATSAVLAGCSYTPKTQTSEKYDNSVELYAPEETVRDKKRISKGIMEDWNEAWQRQNLHRAVDLLSK